MTDNRDGVPTIQVEGSVRPESKPLVQTKAGVDPSAFAAYVNTDTTVSTDTLSALTMLAEEMVAREREVAKCAAALVKATEDLRVIQEERLPDLMESCNPPCDSFGFTDKITGIKRTIELVKDKWRVSMPPKSGKNPDPAWPMKHAAIMEWAYEIGQGAMVKKDMEVPLGLLPDEDVERIAQEFKALHPDADVAIHKYIEPAALTAMINRRLKAGEAVNEYIVTKPVREAKVKGAK